MADNVFDNISVENAENENASNNDGASFDVESWKKKKRDDVENAFALVDEVAGDLSSYAMLNQWLDVRARFDRYSVTNTLLIVAQEPDALKLASYKEWNDQGVHINRGETSLVIFDKIKRYTRADGTTGKQYQTKRVFDIRQTDAKTYPPVSIPVDAVVVMKGLVKASPVKLVIDNDANASLGAVYSRDDNMIHVPKSLGEFPREALVSMLSEITRLRALGDSYKKVPSHEDSQRAAFHSYCVSYIVCKHFGVEPQKKESEYTPTMFADMKPDEIRAHLEVIGKDANNIIYIIDKSRGAIEPKNKNAEENGQAQPNAASPKGNSSR